MFDYMDIYVSNATPGDTTNKVNFLTFKMALYVKAISVSDRYITQNNANCKEHFIGPMKRFASRTS